MKKITKTPRTRGAGAIGADLMLAPLVMAMRLPLMAADAQNGRGLGSETARAINEKATAVAEGAFAAQMALFQSAARFWPEIFSGRTPSLFNGIAVERSISAALKPASRAVKANFRRLSSKD